VVATLHHHDGTDVLAAHDPGDLADFRRSIGGDRPAVTVLAH
jgi:hypothetical protein